MDVGGSGTEQNAWVVAEPAEGLICRSHERPLENARKLSGVLGLEPEVGLRMIPRPALFKAMPATGLRDALGPVERLSTDPPFQLSVDLSSARPQM